MYLIPVILACVASVSVWFRSKERPRNGILGFGRARNETRAKKTPPRSFTYAIFRAVFDSRSLFFAPKPHGNACYAGYSHLHNRKSRILVHNRNNNPTLHKSHIVKVTIIIIPINRVIIGGVYMQLRMAGRGWSTVIESSDSALMCRR